MNIKLMALALVLVAISCTKEQVPAGLILHDEINATDTTYMVSSIPAAQLKQIFVEEATGVHCANCPTGAYNLKNLKNSNPGRILSASVYSPFLNYFQSPSQYDFNSSDDSSIVFYLNGGDPSKPAATIDRLETGVSTSPLFFDQSNWVNIVNGELSKTTPVNIELSATATANVDEFRVKSKITFTDTLTADLNLSLYLIEDHVIDYQDSLGIQVLNYEHNEILRKIITPIPGSSFLSSIATKEKGRVFEKYITFTLPASVNLPAVRTGIVNKANLKLICFVHKTGSSKEVLQAAEIDLP